MVRFIQALKVRDFMPREVAIEKGEQSIGISWLWNGTLEVVDQSGRYAVSVLRQGMMFGENCLVKGAPKNFCSIRAGSWCNILTFYMTDVADVFMSYDRDLHWLQCVSEIRWKRFTAAVALSNVLEIASRRDVPLSVWIHELAVVDEHFVDQTIVDLKVKEQERKSKLRNQKSHSHHPGGLATVRDKQYNTQPRGVPSEDGGGSFSLKTHSTGILKKEAKKHSSAKKVSVSAQDFGQKDKRFSQNCNAESPVSLPRYCPMPLIEHVHGTSMGSGAGVGGRNPKESRHVRGMVNTSLQKFNHASLLFVLCLFSINSHRLCKMSG